MPAIELPLLPSLLAACLVLVVGGFLAQRVPFLGRYSIPAPIIGGSALRGAGAPREATIRARRHLRHIGKDPLPAAVLRLDRFDRRSCPVAPRRRPPAALSDRLVPVPAGAERARPNNSPDPRSAPGARPGRGINHLGWGSRDWCRLCGALCRRARHPRRDGLDDDLGDDRSRHRRHHRRPGRGTADSPYSTGRGTIDGGRRRRDRRPGDDPGHHVVVRPLAGCRTGCRHRRPGFGGRAHSRVWPLYRNSCGACWLVSSSATAAPPPVCGCTMRPRSLSAPSASHCS